MSHDNRGPGAHITSFSAYIDFLSVVIGCAPNAFIRRDWKKEEEQLNLDRAFQVIREKFPLAENRIIDRNVLPRARELIEASYAAYKRDNDIDGAHLIQAFRALILANIKR